jgi:hypothetical protein
MTFPANYTCEQTLHDVRPALFDAARAVYLVIFLSMLGVTCKWTRNALSSVKSLSPSMATWQSLNNSQKMLILLIVSETQYVAYIAIDFQYLNGHTEVGYMLQVMFAFFLDVMLILAATSWTAMNNIQGKKPVVPAFYVHLKHFIIPSNFLVQLCLNFISLNVSTIGDERVVSSNTSWYDGNISVLRTSYNILCECVYAVVMIWEGIKLKKTLSSGGGSDNPAAKKVMKYIKVAVPITVLLLLFRLGTQVLPRINTTQVTALPVCSNAGALIDPTTIMTIIIFSAFMIVMAPSSPSNSKKVNPDTKSTVVSTSSSSSEQ